MAEIDGLDKGSEGAISWNPVNHEQIDIFNEANLFGDDVVTSNKTTEKLITTQEDEHLITKEYL